MFPESHSALDPVMTVQYHGLVYINTEAAYSPELCCEPVLACVWITVGCFSIPSTGSLCERDILSLPDFDI